MAMLSVPETQPGEQPVERNDQHWEADCYQLGCRLARQEAVHRLEALEHRLHAQCPRTWKAKGWAKRTLVTRFGEIRIRRRLYQGKAGAYHCLLDEYLGWSKAQVATPSLIAQVVALASRLPFRLVRCTLARLTAGVLSSAHHPPPGGAREPASADRGEEGLVGLFQGRRSPAE
jgi:Uncharacterised protein family (UPF0236)